MADVQNPNECESCEHYHPHRRDSDGLEVIMDKRAKEPWHLSKSVPLSLIFAIFIQTVVISGAWFTHKSDFENFRAQTLLALETFNGRVDDRYRSSQAASDFALRDERIATLKDNISDVKEAVEGVNNSLDEKFDKLTDLIRDERRRTHPDDPRLAK